MKEVLAWGDIEPQFKRLGIKPDKTWGGYGWDTDDDMSVWQLSDEDFAVLENDAATFVGLAKARCGWRCAEGSNLDRWAAGARINIGGHYLKGWKDTRRDTPLARYGHLLEYLSEQIGATTEKNVTACLVDIARLNGLTLAELMHRHQRTLGPMEKLLVSVYAPLLMRQLQEVSP